LFAFIELFYLRHGLGEPRVEARGLTRGVSHRAHYRPPLLPLHRLALDCCLQLDTYLIYLKRSQFEILKKPRVS
jgi:hypothetical protein